MILKRDGQEIFRGSEIEIWRWLHDRHSFSVDWAVKHEGYSIEPEGGNDEGMLESQEG